MVTEAERGLTVRTTATVGELLEAWFEFAAPDFSPKTVKETRGHIDRSLMLASDITPPSPEALGRVLRRRAGTKYRRLLSPARRSNMAGGLAALLDDVAALAKLAASSVDDVGAAAGRAARPRRWARTD